MVLLIDFSVLSKLRLLNLSISALICLIRKAERENPILSIISRNSTRLSALDETPSYETHKKGFPFE